MTSALFYACSQYIVDKIMKKVKSAFKVFIRKVVTKKILKVGVKNITKRISKPFTRQLKMKIHKNKNLKIPSN